MEIIILIAVIIIIFYLFIRMDMALTLYVASLVGSKKRWVGGLIIWIIIIITSMYGMRCSYRWTSNTWITRSVSI